MPIAIALHVAAAIIWIGGMFFAYMCLRPSLPGLLQAPLPAQLWRAVLGRFFRWVWAAVVVLLATGLWMGFSRYGDLDVWPSWLIAMFIGGTAMMLMFMHVYFAPFKRLNRALDSGDPALAMASIGQIRRMVAINLCLGLVVAVVASAGRYI